MKNTLGLSKSHVQFHERGKSRDLLFLIISSFIFFLLRLPSLFEPHWYGDEGIYQVIGMAINNGSLLYKDIWDNKPPFLYLLYALFDSDQFAVRVASLIFGLLSVIVFFFLTKKLFLTTSIFALLLALPILEGNIANAENFIMLPVLAAALLISNYKFQITNFKLLLAGLLLGIAFLFKVVAIFDFLAFLSLFIIINLPHKLKPSLLKEKEYFLSIIQKLSTFVAGFLIPILITVIYFWTQGAFVDFIRATFLSNISYVAWQNKLILPLGLLLLKITLLIISIVFIVRKRKDLGINTTFILLWFVFSLFSAFLTQRPYTHYLITLLPSFTLMIGLIFWEKKHQKAIVLFFILVFVLVLKNFNFYGKTIAYYQNFVSFLAGQKTVSSYRAFFDKRTLTNYEVTTFIKSKIRGKDTIFIWGNNAQVYKMTGSIPVGKYVVAYHIIDSKDGLTNTKEAIERVKPRFIIIMPDQEPIPFKLIHYSRRIGINNAIIYERFF